MRVAHVCMDRGVNPERKKGAAVHLGAIRRSMRELGAEVIEIDSPDGETVAARLRALHAEAPLDLVYERYSLGATTVADFAREADVPHVLEVNAPLQHEASRYRDGSASEDVVESERRVFSDAQLVVAVSSKVQEFAIGLGARSEHTVIEPNGVDPRLFHPARAEELSGTPVVPAGKFVLGVHGRLRPWHNLGMLAETAAGLLERDLPVHILAVGAGEYAQTLGHHLPEEAFTHISWVPHEEVGRYVACFHVLPLTYDGQDDYFSPLKLREAMAAGAVPVVPAVGDLAADVGDAGVIYEVGSHDALEAALAGLIEDPARRERLSHLAIERASKHSWLAIAKRALEGALAAPR